MYTFKVYYNKKTWLSHQFLLNAKNAETNPQEEKTTALATTFGTSETNAKLCTFAAAAGARFVRSVVTKISWLVLLLRRQREAQRAGIAAVQTEGLLQALLLQPQRLRQVGAQLLRGLALAALVVAVVAQRTAALLLVQLG